MPWAAVIGSPIEHSLSPLIHRELWRHAGITGWSYQKYEVDEASLFQWMTRVDDDCVGISITMPCKKAIIPLLDVVDPQAQALSSVNTLIPSGGLFTGFNTDVFGMSKAIERSRSRAGLAMGGRALIIGTGATAASALAAVVSLGFAHVDVVARGFHKGRVPLDFNRAATNLGVAYTGYDLTIPGTLADRCARADLVVSTLPFGTLDPYIDELASMRTGSSYLDVAYSSRDTAGISLCRSRSIPVAYGVEMLVYQAILQFKLMTGYEADASSIGSVFALLGASRS